MTENKYVSSFYSGISGLQLPVPKYLFPPEYQNSSRLTYYSAFFNSIEINSSFYKIPLPATVAKWSASVHDRFKFTFKLWKGITHIKGLNFQASDVELFFKAIDTAGNKKGCLLIQFPPGLGKENILQLDKLLNCIKGLDSRKQWKIAVEFRNKSWYRQYTYNLLDFHEAALVIQDIPKSATPMINHNSDFIYLRFHGPAGNYRDSYPEEFLSEYAEYIDERLKEGKTVYVYFNNTIGDAFKNLETLNNFIYTKSNYRQTLTGQLPQEHVSDFRN